MTVSLAEHGQPLPTGTPGLETIVVTYCVTLGRLFDFSGLSQVSVWLLPSSLLGVSSEDPGPAELLLIPCIPQALSMTLTLYTPHILLADYKTKEGKNSPLGCSLECPHRINKVS